MKLGTLKIATIVRDGGIEAMDALDALLVEIGTQLPEPEHKVLRLAIARSMDAILENLVNPALKEFPELDVDENTWGDIAVARARMRLSPTKKLDDHARAIADGIKCLENLRKLAKADAQPTPESMLELDALRRALRQARDGTIATDFVPDDALIADIHEVFGWAGEWFTTGQISPTLVPLIEGILAKMGVDLNALDSSP